MKQEVQAALLHTLNHTTRCGIQRSMLQTLLTLRNQRYQMGEFAQEIGVSTAAITGTADRAEACKLIERKVNPEDRRIQFLEITELGIKVLDHLLAGKKVFIHYKKDGRRMTADVEFPGENPPKEEATAEKAEQVPALV